MPPRDLGGIFSILLESLSSCLQSYMATTIGTTITINGDVTCDEPLRIDGRVTGNILLREAELTVGKAAQVDADVRSARVLVLGTVNGNVAATDRIELGESANVTGSLSADRVVLIEGARFNGRIDMDRRTIAAKVAQYKAEHPAQP